MTKSIALAAALLTGSALVAWTPAPALAQKKERDLISREEILASAQKDQDAFFLIRSLRPHFLAPPRGVRTLGGAPAAATALYINGTRAGDLAELRLLSAADVEEVRYLDPSRAENEFGISHSGGAIMVKTVKSSRLDRKLPRF